MKHNNSLTSAFLGLVLTCLSVIIEVFLSQKGDDTGAANALVPSTNGNANGYTCTFTVVAGDPCTRTATGVECGTGSRTSTEINPTSSITTTNCVNKVRTRTEVDPGRSIGANVLNSSFSPA